MTELYAGPIIQPFGIVDTNADPTDITYPVPMNDDAIKALQLVADYIQSTVEAGKAKMKKPFTA